MMMTTTPTQREALIELARRKAQADLLSFIRFTWDLPTPFVIGKHTRAICDRLTTAVDDWLKGKSTFLNIAVPPRHGKSRIASVAFPAFFLGRTIQAGFDPSVILSGYSSDFVNDFSKECKALVNSPRYQFLFPQVKIAHGSDRSDVWKVKDKHGQFTAVGIGGGLTGRSMHLGIIDDPIKSAAESMSETYRENTWNFLTSDFLTRRTAPACIVLLIGTPWHVDGLEGRIEQKMKEDPNFPRFERLIFPARTRNKDDQYEYLFPEMFDEEWYLSQYAALGKRANALLDCNPVPLDGGLFNIANITTQDHLPDPVTPSFRVWDLASTAKERTGHSPDYTVGTKGYLDEDGNLVISDMRLFQEDSPKRDAIINDTMRSDSNRVQVWVEDFGAYRDTLNNLRRANPTFTINECRQKGDKIQKAQNLETLLYNHKIIISSSIPQPVRDEFVKQMTAFPNGLHDDAVDSPQMLLYVLEKRRMKLSPLTVNAHSNGIL